MTKRPNIILLSGEDTGRHMGCYEDAFARTPHLDRLAAEGCRFTHAFSTAPVCAPARASIVTGQRPCKIGTHLMRSRVAKPPRLFTHELIDAGYYVNWANKTDFNFENPENFRTESSDWAQALESGTLNDRPFFLYFNDTVTHESRMWPPGVIEGHDVPDQILIEEPGVDDAALDDLPGMVIPPYLPDNRITRASLVRYYQALEKQDATWGRLLAALEQSGVADNTIVIYLTDHGRGLIREKRWCYEAGIHLPLIVRAPAHMDLVKAGTVRDDLVSWVDIAPTILALAGVDRPDTYDGRVFLGEETATAPDCVFSGRDRMESAFDRVRVVRDARYLYIKNDYPEIPYAQKNSYMEASPVTRNVRELAVHGELKFPENSWMQPEKPGEELYDTVMDPHCVVNLSDRNDHRDILERLRHRCAEWRAQVGDKGLVQEQQWIEQDFYEPSKYHVFDKNIHLPEQTDPADSYYTRKVNQETGGPFYCNP
jgi:arylsulfatase A-like enzyme